MNIYACEILIGWLVGCRPCVYRRRAMAGGRNAFEVLRLVNPTTSQYHCVPWHGMTVIFYLCLCGCVCRVAAVLVSISIVIHTSFPPGAEKPAKKKE
jgi:hypothetical protein